MRESEAELQALRAFQGSSAHQAILGRFRRALTAELAYFLSNQWDPVLMQTCHCRVRALVEVLSSQDFRLDNIDIPELASGAVSQFEASLPTRIQFNQDYVERHGEEV